MVLIFLFLQQVEISRHHKEAFCVEVDNGFSITPSGQLSRLKVVRNPILSSENAYSIGTLKAPVTVWETVFGVSSRTCVLALRFTLSAH